MKTWTNENGVKMYEPDCVDEWLYHIMAIGVDYDGYCTAEDLKELIDELVSMTSKARKCLWNNKLFGEFGSPDGNDV